MKNEKNLINFSKQLDGGLRISWTWPYGQSGKNIGGMAPETEKI